MPLPFAPLGLRRNPFGALADDERAALAIVEIDGWVDWLHGGKRALQLMDPPGRGKSTHLLALRRRIPETVLVRPLQGIPRAPRTGLLLLDDAQLVPLWRRVRLWRRAGPVALATHRDFTRELTLFGFQVQTVRPSAAWTLERFKAAVDARVMASLDGPANGTTVSNEVAATVFHRCGTDVRAALDWLYDEFQHRELRARGWASDRDRRLDPSHA
ncbi:MAG TPA: hypothetical protein VGA22_07610 [Gemmatimonadales bacterium]|jgi:hypothetical protein